MDVEEEIFWRALHSLYLETFDEMPDFVRAEIYAPNRVTFAYFLALLQGDLLRVVPILSADDVPCIVIEGKGPEDDWTVLAAIPAERLSVDPDIVREAIRRDWEATFNRLVELPGGAA